MTENRGLMQRVCANLVTPAQMSDEDFEKFQTSLGAALQYIKYSKDQAELNRRLKTNQKFQALDRRTVEVINAVTGSNLKIDEKEEVVNVCEAIEGMKRDAVREATKRVEAETKVESIKHLMETLKFSAEQAMDALKIPEEERTAYLQRL
jgi:hypothetical protein